jgi:rare lipoprotein A (peptidoglycan hydrolase)
MGSEVQKHSDGVAEVNTPKSGATNLGVDLSDPAQVKDVFKYDPRCELGPTGKLPEFDSNSVADLAAGKPVDIMGAFAKRDGITLPDVAVTDEKGNVIAGSTDEPGKKATPPREADPGDARAAAPEVVKPEDAPAAVATELKTDTLDAAKVRKKEGYHQVSSRLLGDGFSHDEKKAFTNALKSEWKSNPENGDGNVLKRGDALLTQKNLDKVLNSIEDEGLRNRIRERLTSAEFAPDAQPEQKRQRRERDEAPAPERRERIIPKPERRPEYVNPEPTVNPEARREETRPSEPDGPFKSPFLKRYNEGDRFEGITSMYRSGRETASGLPFNKYELTAASREFPFGTVLKVTNPDTGKEIRVVVTDHGPFAGKKVERPDGSGEKVHNRVIDLSLGASNALGMGYTVKNLQYKVESIPEDGKWGKDRRNIHGDYRRRVQADVRRVSRERGVNA